MPASNIRPTTSHLTAAHHWDHWLARWGIKRGAHRVEPGLYALGAPTPDAPVFVTANYTLSFDALRSALAGLDAYILVLDTQGINVWCAAGEGNFGTDEIVRRVEAAGLAQVVSHHTLILPQLGAPGVAAHEVKKRTGFKVEYGPVRATDLPEYLKTHQATPEMRRVRFPLRDRLVLVPVELVHTLIPLLIVGLLLQSWPAVVAILAGVALFPLLLPWLPTHNFTTKGYILGALVQVPFIVLVLSQPSLAWWVRGLRGLSFLMAMAPVTAFLALNFTGSTPFTSRTGVRSEIFAYIRSMAWVFGVGVILNVATGLRFLVGG